MKAIIMTQITTTIPSPILISNHKTVSVFAEHVHENITCISAANGLAVLISSKDDDHPVMGVFKVATWDIFKDLLS